MIAQLNEKHGLDYDGPDSPNMSLIICDPTETWILDIAGKLWAAEQVAGMTFCSLPIYLYLYLLSVWYSRGLSKGVCQLWSGHEDR